MKSLFPKILIWLVLTAIATAVASLAVAILAMPDPVRASPWPGRVLQFLADDAWRIYRAEGPKGLDAWLLRLSETTQMNAHLLNTSGRDLADSSDRSELLHAVLRTPLLMARSHGRLLTARHSSDGKSVFLLYPPARLSSFPLLIPHHLAVAACVILFSFLLARHLTNPIKRVEAAAERLGKGDLSARAPVDRKDEVGRLAASFNQMADRVQSLVESQRRLLLDVSHELRSPLARLNVAVELARSSENPRQELDVIQQQADRLNSLVGSLLQVSRAETSPASLRSELVDLRSLIDDVAAACTLEGQVDVSGASSLPTSGDSELLRRAVENIVRNAIRYSPPESAVQVILEPRPQSARILVRDRGPGVPEHALPFLFDAFYRVEGQSAPGSGLGLSIARRAVELHGGSISAANAGPGLLVSIELPLVK